MSSLWLLFIALGLSLDAFAVAVARGCAVPRMPLGQALKMAIFFGAFQALMPALGWLAGAGCRLWIEALDHWVAFGLLLGAGGKMIWEAFSRENADASAENLSNRLLLLLALATSVDALAVGLSFAMLGVELVYPALLIGAVTFGLSAIGAYAGRSCGRWAAGKIEILGGLILIGIGVKILISHLG